MIEDVLFTTVYNEGHELFSEQILSLANALRDVGISVSKRNKTLRYRRLRAFSLHVTVSDRYPDLFELQDELDGVIYTMLTEKEVVDYILQTVEDEKEGDFRNGVFANLRRHERSIRKMYSTEEKQ